MTISNSPVEDARQVPFRIWLQAARPKTLWAGVIPVLMGSALAFDQGVFHGGAVLAALLGSVFIQIGANYANDYFDFIKGTDTEERLGPVRATQAGLVTPGQMRVATAVAFLLAVLAGVYLVYRGGMPIVVIGVVSILCGILYTGGPYPLGYLGLGDVFVLVFFGPVAVAGTYYVQALTWDGASVVAGLAPGFFSVALLTVNNLRDAETDVKTGKKTLAVRLGPTFARVEYAVALALGAVVVPFYLVWAYPGHGWALIASLVFLLAVPDMNRVFKNTVPAELNAVLGGTGKLLLIFGILFSIGWIL
jgi:1,4-dihydroxy-2-naphthoate polyprenyltransferase